jgi:hypothetical protein
MSNYDDYNDYMKDLATRMSHVVEGEDLFDVASACSLLAAFSIVERFPIMSERKVALEKIVAFIKQVVEK